MRRPLLAVATAGLLATTSLLAQAAPALAHPDVPLAPARPTDLTYSATDNVDYLGRFPEHSGTAGGALSEDGTRYYLTDPRGVHVYDTTTPASPRLLGSLPLYQQSLGAALAQEDPDTNGKILLVDGSSSPVGTARLNVVDVSDPTRMKVLSTVAVTDHTWTCVTAGDNTCAYAYGRSGHVVDLTDPREPKRLPTTWRQFVGLGTPGSTANSPYTHDLTEVRPGLVLSAGAVNVLMDTRDPQKPVLLNTLDQKGRFPSLGFHSAEWARGGKDRFLVLGTEIAPSGPTNTAGSDCKGEASVIETWDARAVKDAVDAYFDGHISAVEAQKAQFSKIDAYSVSGRGLFLAGAAPGHVLFCAHWMEQHPQFKNGGLLTVSYYDRGTRFVEVGKDGRMTEKGWIVAAEGYSGSSQWASGSVVYVSDYRRGLEVVELTGKKATGVRSGEQDVIALGSLALAASTSPAGPAQGPLAAAAAALLLLVPVVGTLRARRRRA